jgi:hypothetical protein
MEGKEIGAFTLVSLLGRIKSKKVKESSEYELDDCTGIIEFKDELESKLELK